MPGRINDPQDLEDWMVKTDQRLRQLESRRLDAGAGTEVDYATKTVSTKISADDGNTATIGEDGGIYAPDTVTTASPHTPLIVMKEMTASQNIANATDSLITWGAETLNQGFTTTTTSAITIPEAGNYLITFQWQWANNATGIRGLKITLNSVTVGTGSILSNTLPVVSNNESAHQISSVIDFAGGEILRAYVFQSSGGALLGGGPYFGDIRGRWQITKMHDAPAPELTTE